MNRDKSDEIRVAVLKQRTEKLLKYLKRKRSLANADADGSGSSWNHACADTLNKVYERAQRIFSGKEDKPVGIE